MTTQRVHYKNKIWDKDAVRNLLSESPEALGRALMVVYNNQTADEQSAMVTKHTNGKGFTGMDAGFLTDVAVRWKRWGRWASDRQRAAVLRAMTKYHRQILDDIASRPGAVSLTPKQAVPVAEQQPEERWTV